MKKLQDEDLVRVKMADLRRLQRMEHDYNRMKARTEKVNAIADKMMALLKELAPEKEGTDGGRKADQPE